MLGAWATASVLGLAGCTGAPVARPAAPGATAGPAVTGVAVGGVALRVEVADTPVLREAGLRGRAGVPTGTGMVFRFDRADRVRFTMAGVSYPLVAVFLRSGTVVGVSQMVPCAGSVQACPTYGPDTAVDTVVEAAPGSLPDVRVGDPATGRA